MPFVNPLTAAWERGDVVRGGWCTSPSAVVAETMASVGFDYVCVDLQHGAVDVPDAIHMFQAISGRGVAPLARVPANDFTTIGRTLDAGALGVIVPLVDTPEQAAAAVAACRYPPRGTRSFGPVRAATVMGSTAPTDLDRVVVAVMVETRAGLDNVERIAATPGLDAIYCGPADLSLALGLPPAFEQEAAVHVEALARVRTACTDAGIVAGVHCADGDMAARRLAQGFRMATVTTDLTLVQSGAAAELTRART